MLIWKEQNVSHPLSHCTEKILLEKYISKNSFSFNGIMCWGINCICIHTARFYFSQIPVLLIIFGLNAPRMASFKREAKLHQLLEPKDHFVLNPKEHVSALGVWHVCIFCQVLLMLFWFPTMLWPSTARNTSQASFLQVLSDRWGERMALYLMCNWASGITSPTVLIQKLLLKFGIAITWHEMVCAP